MLSQRAASPVAIRAGGTSHAGWRSGSNRPHLVRSPMRRHPAAATGDAGRSPYSRDANSPPTYSSTIMELQRANTALKEDVIRCLSAVRDARQYSDEVEAVLNSLPDFMVDYKAGMMDLCLLQNALFLEHSQLVFIEWEDQRAIDKERYDGELASVFDDYKAQLQRSEMDQSETLREIQVRWHAVATALRDENHVLLEKISSYAEEEQRRSTEEMTRRTEEEAAAQLQAERDRDRQCSAKSLGVQVAPVMVNRPTQTNDNAYRVTAVQTEFTGVLLVDRGVDSLRVEQDPPAECAWKHEPVPSASSGSWRGTHREVHYGADEVDWQSTAQLTAVSLHCSEAPPEPTPAIALVTTQLLEANNAAAVRSVKQVLAVQGELWMILQRSYEQAHATLLHDYYQESVRLVRGQRLQRVDEQPRGETSTAPPDASLRHRADVKNEQEPLDVVGPDVARGLATLFERAAKDATHVVAAESGLVVSPGTSLTQAPKTPLREPKASKAAKPIVSTSKLELQITALSQEVLRLESQHLAMTEELAATRSCNKLLSRSVVEQQEQLILLRSALEAVEGAAFGSGDSGGGPLSQSKSSAAPTPRPLEHIAAAPLSLHSLSSTDQVTAWQQCEWRIDPEGNGVAQATRLGGSASTLLASLGEALGSKGVEGVTHTEKRHRTAAQLNTLAMECAQAAIYEELKARLPLPEPVNHNLETFDAVARPLAGCAPSDGARPTLHDWMLATERATQWCALLLCFSAHVATLQRSLEEKYATMENRDWDRQVTRKVMWDIRNAVSRIYDDVVRVPWQEHRARFPLFFQLYDRGPNAAGRRTSFHSADPARRSRSAIASSLYVPRRADDVSGGRPTGQSASHHSNARRQRAVTRADRS